MIVHTSSHSDIVRRDQDIGVLDAKCLERRQPSSGLLQWVRNTQELYTERVFVFDGRRLEPLVLVGS
jgi:hypothetical protein